MLLLPDSTSFHEFLQKKKKNKKNSRLELRISRILKNSRFLSISNANTDWRRTRSKVKDAPITRNSFLSFFLNQNTTRTSYNSRDRQNKFAIPAASITRGGGTRLSQRAVLCLLAGRTMKPIVYPRSLLSGAQLRDEAIEARSGVRPRATPARRLLLQEASSLLSRKSFIFANPFDRKKGWRKERNVFI